MITVYSCYSVRECNLSIPVADIMLICVQDVLNESKHSQHARHGAIVRERHRQQQAEMEMKRLLTSIRYQEEQLARQVATEARMRQREYQLETKLVQREAERRAQLERERQIEAQRTYLKTQIDMAKDELELLKREKHIQRVAARQVCIRALFIE
jgi:FMN phosphatase YigB (HAD superfamily)